MPVTFDSNVYRLVVCPGEFPRDSRFEAMQWVHESKTIGSIQGNLNESILIIEAIEKKIEFNFLFEKAQN